MSSESYLEGLLGYIGKTIRFNDSRSLASIAEQVISSGMNMMMSVVIVYAGGVAELGVYSFYFALTILASNNYQALICKQMLLLSSARNEASQAKLFVHAFKLILWLSSAVTVLASICYFAYTAVVSGNWSWVPFSVLFYILMLSIFDLFKHYLFVKNKQVYSLRCTILGACTSGVLVGSSVAFIPGEFIVGSVYLSLGSGFLLSLLMNRECLDQLKDNWVFGREGTFLTASNFWREGRFGTVGASMSWGQSQSIIPIVMVVAGPVITGYVSLGRLFIMPLNVVNQGLINSSSASLRRVLKGEGVLRLVHEIHRLLLITYRFAAMYLVSLLSLHFLGIPDKLVPEYQEASTFIVFWTFVVLVSFARYWFQQFFFIQNRLKLLLQINLVTTAIFIAGVLVSVFVLQNHIWIFASMIFSEFVAIALITRAKRREIP